MTTLPRIQLHDPDHPQRTVIRIAFWLTIATLLMLAVVAGIRNRSTPHQVTPAATPKPATVRSSDTDDTGVVRTPVRSTKKPPVKTRAARPTPRPGKGRPIPTPSRTARPAPAPRTSPSRVTAPTRPVPSKPSTPAPKPKPAVPVPVDPVPPPRPSGNAGGSSGATTPAPTTQTPTPKPPSAHNCDANNEAC